jgi:hypothetical protein
MLLWQTNIMVKTAISVCPYVFVLVPFNIPNPKMVYYAVFLLTWIAAVLFLTNYFL